ncbi:MAG TPA: flagellar basal body rod protein FlgB [Chloroflexota bacterium]|nr:flagellar basal body rod protein FlgB [Chloroflexota bacterium]
MNISVDGILHSALDGLNLRQQVTANNIANADTPGFKAQTVNFEDQLVQAMQAANGDPATFAADAQPVIQQNTSLSANQSQNSVDMDQQLLLMSDTTMRYSAVSQTLAQRYALYNAIITDGKG